jgi:predicted ferric reductase
VWLALGASALSLQQHPFTIASSAAHSRRIELTIKELGDFTSSVGRLDPGTRAYLEGPYGSFTLDGTDATCAAFIAGGIGITPAMSMLRTLRDRGDRRPLTLVYANETLAKAVFRHEIEALCAELPLEVIHVLEKPAAGWCGETGYVTREVLERRLDLHAAGAHYFVCGPGPMMDGVERGLRAAGVPGSRIHAERFDIA